MGGIRATFTQKLGPLPVWAWAAIVVAAAVGYMWWKKIGIFAPASAGPTNAVNGGYDPNTATDTSSGSGGGSAGIADPVGQAPAVAGGSGTGVPGSSAWSPQSFANSDLGGILNLGAPPDSSGTPGGNGVISNAGTPGTVLSAPNSGLPLSVQGFFGTPFTPAVTPAGYVAPTSGTIAQRVFYKPPAAKAAVQSPAPPITNAQGQRRSSGGQIV